MGGRNHAENPWQQRTLTRDLDVGAQDLLNAATGAEIMQELSLTTFKDRWIHVQACSAKTSEGLEDGMAELVKNTKNAA